MINNSSLYHGLYSIDMRSCCDNPKSEQCKILIFLVFGCDLDNIYRFLYLKNLLYFYSQFILPYTTFVYIFCLIRV